MAATLRLRQYARLPVHIVEDHDGMLPHVCRAVGSRHLPYSVGLTASMQLGDWIYFFASVVHVCMWCMYVCHVCVWCMCM